MFVLEEVILGKTIKEQIWLCSSACVFHPALTALGFFYVPFQSHLLGLRGSVLSSGKPIDFGP